MKRKQTAVEYLMSLDPKLRESVFSGMQQLDDDLKNKKLRKKILNQSSDSNS